MGTPILLATGSERLIPSAGVTEGLAAAPASRFNAFLRLVIVERDASNAECYPTW